LTSVELEFRASSLNARKAATGDDSAFPGFRIPAGSGASALNAYISRDAERRRAASIRLAFRIAR
jgi:hypothetical protein